MLKHTLIAAALFTLTAGNVLMLGGCRLITIDGDCVDGPCFIGSQVDSCDGVENCSTSTYCGEVVYCEAPPECPATECAEGYEAVSYCSESDADCEAVRTPGCVGFCQIAQCEPELVCDEGPILDLGEGSCDDLQLGTGCVEQEACGLAYFCDYACPAGGTEVEGPWDCEDMSDCYPVDHFSGDLDMPYKTWCEGGGPACEAAPTCDTDVQLLLSEECPEGFTCEYRTVCSGTVQCALATEAE